MLTKHVFSDASYIMTACSDVVFVVV